MDRLRIEVLASAADVAERAARDVAELIRERAGRSLRTSLMLAGGTTPRATYQRLSERDLPWHTVDFFFGDERAVAPDHPDSNFAMAKAALFDPVCASSSQVHRMLGESADLESAAESYARALPPALDMMILGMGEDGHTASIFPGQPAARERSRAVVVVTAAPKPPPTRLTITPPVIARAARCLVLVTGTGKRAALARARTTEDTSAVPVCAARHGLFLVDRDAAGEPQGERND